MTLRQAQRGEGGAHGAGSDGAIHRSCRPTHSVASISSDIPRSCSCVARARLWRRSPGCFVKCHTFTPHHHAGEQAHQSAVCQRGERASIGAPLAQHLKLTTTQILSFLRSLSKHYDIATLLNPPVLRSSCSAQRRPPLQGFPVPNPFHFPSCASAPTRRRVCSSALLMSPHPLLCSSDPIHSSGFQLCSSSSAPLLFCSSAPLQSRHHDNEDNERKDGAPPRRGSAADPPGAACQPCTSRGAAEAEATAGGSPPLATAGSSASSRHHDEERDAVLHRDVGPQRIRRRRRAGLVPVPVGGSSGGGNCWP
jgi:hypothetical protein